MPTLRSLFLYQVYRWLLAGLLLLGYAPVQAQEFYPVVARFTQLPPYPVYLADFSNPSQTNLSIQVQQNDRSIASRPFRIRVYIEGQGFQVQSTDLVQGEPPLTLSFGQVYSLPAEQVANYFKQYNLKISAAQYARPFSEGAFRFGVEIIDYATNRPISGVQWANPVWITINEPPVWIMPQNALTMTPVLPQNIIFQWSPRHTNVNDVEYEFTITDLLISRGFSGNVQNLFLAQPPYYKTRTRTTTLVYDPTMPPLVPGRTYAYRVEAIAKRGREDVGVFRNNGFSEIQYFNYGTPLLPPSNLRLTWNDANTTEASFNWKGESNHQSFVVEIREKGKNGPWRSTTLNPQATGLYSSFTFNGLDPTRPYEARVTAAGGDGQRAISEVVPLSSLQLVNQTGFSIRGHVNWAFNSTEEAFSKPGTLFGTSSTITPRQIVRQPWPEQQAGDRRFALNDAIISLYNTGSTPVDASTFARQRSSYSLIQTVSSDAQGNFEFKGETIKLLQQAENLFLVARFKNNAFGEAMTPFKIPTKPEGVLKSPDMTLIANTFRYAPTFLLPAGDQAVADAVEEVALYRLKSVVEAAPYLAQEGNASTRTEVRFNNEAYVKMATFNGNQALSRLFTNHLFNDQLLVVVRQKGQEPQFFPITGIEEVKAGQSLTVNDQFRYLSSSRRIWGIVGRGTLASPVANATVQVAGQPYTTDKNGRYEALVPASIKPGQAITVTVPDPLDNSIRLTQTPAFSGTSLEQNMLLTDNAVHVVGLVHDETKRPLAGAVVTMGAVSVKTQPNGYFSLVLDEPALLALDARKDSVRIMADAYAPLKLSLNAFARTAVAGSSADNQDNWLRALGQTNSLKNAPQSEGTQPIVTAETYGRLFTSAGKRAVAIHEKADIQLTLVQKKYRIQLYVADDKRTLGLRSLTDSLTNQTFLPADTELLVENTPVKSGGQAGYVATTTGTTVTVAFKNKGAGSLYSEVTQTVKLPAKPHKRDTIYTFAIRLRPAAYVRGMVLDSTLFVAGLHTDKDSLVVPGPDLANRLRPIAGAKVENEGVGEAETDAKGTFRILVEKGRENTLKLSKPTTYVIRDDVRAGKAIKDTSQIIAYNDVQMSVSEADINAFAASDPVAFAKLIEGTPNRLQFKRGYLTRRERSVPTFTKLLTFDATVEQAVRNSGADAGKGGETYKISGKIQLDKWAKNSKDGSTLFGITKGKELTLTFKDVIVKADPKDKTNAVPVLSSVNLVETEFDALLFGFAPVKVEGNPAGEPFIRLQQVAGQAGQGKVGGATWQFMQTQLAGFNFGKMELTKKKPDKVAKAGDFNDKDAVDDAKDQKKLADKRAGKKDEKKDDKAKIPEKEPYLVAFATKNLEDMKDDAEYAVEFITGGSARQSEKAAAAGSKNVQFDPNYARFPLGNAPQGPGMVQNTVGNYLNTLVPYVNIERKEVVLKKSGISMKGSLSLPTIPYVASDSAKLILEKLEIDKEFKLKQATFALDGKKNIWEAVAGGKTTSGFLLEVKSFQIVNDFKGYGISGRISNDKDNYVDVNSLTFNVVDGTCFPATELSLPNQGFRVKSIRFRPSGKKTIVFKRNTKDKSYELETSLNVEYDGSAPKTALTDSTDKFGKSLTEADQKALAGQPKPAQPTDATPASGGVMSSVFPFELQKFVWSTTGKWVVSAKPRPIDLIPGLVKLNIRRLVFTKAGKKPDGSADALKKSEVNDLLAMNEEEVNQINRTVSFNQANTTIKKDSLGNAATDKDGNRLREGALSKESQTLRGNTSSERLTIKELAEKIVKADPPASMAFGFAGGFSTDAQKADGIKFDSDVSLVVGDFGEGWETSINEIMIKMESTAFKAFGKVKVSMLEKKKGFEGAIDLETADNRFAANLKYYKLPKGIELGAGFQASSAVPMGPITWSSLGGGFDLNTEDQKYKVFLIGSAVPTPTMTNPKLCQYKNIRLLVEFDNKACGAKPVIKGNGEMFVNGDKYCETQLELDFCRTRLMAKLNCEIEVSKESKAEVNALVIADPSIGIFLGANVRVAALGGLANGVIGVPIVFRTTAGVADGMPPELSLYTSKIPAYLLQADNTTATGSFLKMDMSREFKWSDRVSVAGLSLVEANVEAVLRGDLALGVNFRTGSFRVLGQTIFDAEGRVSIIGLALNGKMGLGLTLDGGFMEDKGWNFAAQARGELQVWRDNSASLGCNDYKIEREWYWDDVCVDRSWWGGCKRTERQWVPYPAYRLDKLTTKVKVCLSGSYGAQYQSRGGNAGWKLLK
ncbi:fibronectin type III domain-containing protein [Spirosoma lituiforme]